MTTILNGNSFVHSKPLQMVIHFYYQLFVQALNIKSKKQKPKCTNCCEEYWPYQCSGKKRCRICLETDHEPGSEECKAFFDDQKHVISFTGLTLYYRIFSVYLNCILNSSLLCRMRFTICKSHLLRISLKGYSYTGSRNGSRRKIED